MYFVERKLNETPGGSTDEASAHGIEFYLSRFPQPTYLVPEASYKVDKAECSFLTWVPGELQTLVAYCCDKFCLSPPLSVRSFLSCRYEYGDDCCYRRFLMVITARTVWLAAGVVTT